MCNQSHQLERVVDKSKSFNRENMPLKKFLINRNKNRKFRLNGLLRSTRLPNKERLCQAFNDHLLYSPDQLPPKTDLRDSMTPVEDQSQIGSW